MDELVEQLHESLSPWDARLMANYFFLQRDCKNLVGYLKDPEAELMYQGAYTKEQYKDLVKSAEEMYRIIDAVEPEMPLCLARAVRRVESAAVVAHGNAKSAASHFTGDTYFRRLSMAYGVRDELADRVQDSVRRRIAYGGARPGEAHCNGCPLQKFLQKQVAKRSSIQF